jgi:hypothetical protein
MCDTPQESNVSGQGYHFAIAREQAGTLLECADEMAVLDFTNELVDHFLRGGAGCGGYKEWPVLHQCLSDGTFDPNRGTPPLNRPFLGGYLLMTEGSVVNLVPPEQVRETAAAVACLDEPWLRKRLLEVFPEEGDAGLQDMGWYCGLLQELKEFYRKAAAEGRAVLFYTDDCLSYFHKPGAE